MIPDLTYGLDLGDKRSAVCVLSRAGVVVLEGTVMTTPTQMREWFSQHPRGRVAMETSTHSRWAAEVLQHLGYEVVVANPRQIALIHGSRRKNDRRDAERLARLARLDVALLHPIRHRSEGSQRALVTIKARKTLVGTRTRLVTTVRSLVKSFGHRVAPCDAGSFPARAREAVPATLLAALEPLLSALEHVQTQIRGLDAEVRRLGHEVWPDAKRLRQVGGIGPVTSLAFVLTVEDPHRFRRSRDVGAYLGLVPAQDQSGETDRRTRITKTGDQLVRGLLVQAAHHVLGPSGDTDLRRWGLRRMEHGMNRKKVLIAVARKLVVLLHRLWVTGADYDPLRNATAGCTA